VAGLNPAWQQVFVLPGLRTGEVNRAGAYRALASGKGLNAAKVLARRGHAVSILQILAGASGKRVLEACSALGVRSLHVRTEGETRACATLLHDGRATEIIAPFSVADAALPDQLLGRVRDGAAYDALLICGTMPGGLPDGLHAALAARVRAPLLLWDSVAGLTEGLLPRVSWIKVNAEEHRALAPLLERSPARPSLLITDGAAPAAARIAEAAWRCTVPPPEAVLNPIGAGDTVAAMLADGLLRGLDARAAIAGALAAASASCANLLPAEWEPREAARIERDIRWTDA
jgi:1-phosphofructokinase